MPTIERAIVPLERQQLSADLDGSRGLYRNPHGRLALIRADNDLAAIREWLASAGARSAATERSYRKEAERLLAWSIVEQGKPVSSLNIQDMLDYERFLRNPISKHPGITWVARKYMDPDTGAETVRRYRRDDPEWRPFDGGLAQASIEHAIQILRSLFAFWTDVGYTVVNPLKVRRRHYRPEKNAAVDRVLSPATWRYLYGYLEKLEDSIPEAASAKQRLRLLRQANQRYMVFTALYLLGVRISELVAIRMCDFIRRHTADGEDHYWLRVVGKGNKTRTIPVPAELLDVIARYRRVLNTFPVQKRRATDKTMEPLATLPSSKDDTTLILSATGTQSLTANALHKIVKSTLADALEHLRDLEADGIVPANVNAEQLENASTHWMRHTSATHQGLKGVSLRYVKDYLGHASYDTTVIYDHLDNDHWVREISKFHT